MKSIVLLVAIVTALGASVVLLNIPSESVDENSYLWLEEVMGEKALSWVRERNTESLEELMREPDFEC